jgi:hypothetical protein
MKKLEIDISLTLKIIENENKLKKLFNSTNKRNRYNSTDYKYYNTEKVSENENLSSSKNDNIENVKQSLRNKNVYDENIINQLSSQKTMEIEKKNSKKIIKVNKSKNSKVNSQRKENKRNNTSKSDLSLNPFVSTIRNNPINSFHHNSTAKTPLNRNITSIKYMNVERMITRFRENEEKIKEWIKKERTKKEIEENKHYQNSPKINNRSKKINLKIKDGFLLRLQKSEDEKQQKAEILKEFLKNKKIEEEKKHKGLKVKSRTKHTNLSTGKKISETLNKFHAIEEKRKAKINIKRKIKFPKEINNAFIHKINKRSTSMAELRKLNYSTNNLLERFTIFGKYSIKKKNI